VSGPLPIWFELLENACIAALGLAGVAVVWAVLDHRSAAARRARELLRRRGVLRALVMGAAASIFIIAAEDVLDGEPYELLVRLDWLVRETTPQLRAQPMGRALASGVSALTGPGLVGGLILGAVGLTLVNRRRDALVILGGTLSAWLVSAGLKLAFGVPRPAHGPTLHTISGYGFPSAHALVATVACGLLAWSAARGAPGLVRAGLYAAAVLLATGAGLSRVVLDAHWLSDVIAGLAVGVLWLNAVLLAAPRLGDPAVERPG
jgi:membrane-associated phospholipid phosphatase